MSIFQDDVREPMNDKEIEKSTSESAGPVYVRSGRGHHWHVIRTSSRTWCRWRFKLARDAVMAADASVLGSFCKKCTARATGRDEPSSDSSASPA